MLLVRRCDQFFQRVVQLTVGKRLVQETIRALPHGFDGRRLVRERRDHQDQNVRLDGDDTFDALDAVHVRHRDVHRDDVRVGLAEELERIEAVGGRPTTSSCGMF